MVKQLFTFFFIAIFFQLICTAQSDLSKDFTKIIASVTGDLNKDGISDSVIVMQDTVSEFRPYRLEIFFIQRDETMELVVSTDSAVIAEFPDGSDGYITGAGFDVLRISKGVLWIENQLLRGHYNHKFRYQNECFELIGFTYVSSDGLGKIYNIDYNLSTGKLVELTESYEDDQVFKDSTSFIKLDVLPKLSEFIPFTGEYY